jgi:hypothetical protein
MSEFREEDLTDTDALGAIREQVGTAEAKLYDGPESWLHLPWSTLDALVGGIGEGNVWFVGGFSGHGKTTFLMDLTAKLTANDRTVYYLGTETAGNELRTRLACQRVGVYAGHVLSGASRSWHNWDEIRADLVKDIRSQLTLGDRDKFLVCPSQRINATGLRGAFQNAGLNGADLLIIDHIDHVAHGGGKSGFEDSRMLAGLVLDEAQRTGLRVVAATQFNNESLRGDRLGPHQPPQPHHVYMGSHKRQIAWGMLGVYRPLREDLTADDLKKARAGALQPDQYLEADTMAVSIMKHRYYGAHEGRRVKLRFDHGRLSDIPEKDRYETSYDGQRRI